MVDDPKPPDPAKPPEPPPATPPPTEPAPAVPATVPAVPDGKPSPEMTAKAAAQAAYFSRHPEELELTIEHMEQSGFIQAQDHDRIDTLERQLAVRDAIDEHGLSKEDIPFITGNTKEEIDTAAATLKARYDKVKGVVPDEAPPTTKIPVTKMGQPLKATKPGETPPATAPPPELSETVKGAGGVPSIDAAKGELAKSLEGVTYE